MHSSNSTPNKKSQEKKSNEDLKLPLEMKATPGFVKYEDDFESHFRESQKNLLEQRIDTDRNPAYTSYSEIRLLNEELKKEKTIEDNSFKEDPESNNSFRLKINPIPIITDSNNETDLPESFRVNLLTLARNCLTERPVINRKHTQNNLDRYFLEDLSNSHSPINMDPELKEYQRWDLSPKGIINCSLSSDNSPENRNKKNISKEISDNLIDLDKYSIYTETYSPISNKKYRSTVGARILSNNGENSPAELDLQKNVSENKNSEFSIPFSNATLFSNSNNFANNSDAHSKGFPYEKREEVISKAETNNEDYIKSYQVDLLSNLRKSKEKKSTTEIPIPRKIEESSHKISYLDTPKNRNQSTNQLSNKSWLKKSITVDVNSHNLDVSKDASRSFIKHSSIYEKSRDQEGHTKLNQYLIIKELGRGAFGKVKLVEDTSDNNKQYAIKIFDKTKLRKKLLTRKINAYTLLEREIAVMKKLDHPNIVRLIEVIQDDENNKLYLILEYIGRGHVLSKQYWRAYFEEKGRNEQNILVEAFDEEECEEWPLDPENLRIYARDFFRGLEYSLEIQFI